MTAGETTNSGQNGTVSVNVYDHASGSVGNSALALGNVHAGYASPVTSTSVSATNASGYRVDLAGSTSAIGHISLSSLSGIAAGNSGNITATLATGQTAGAINQAFTYTFADSSSLSGASSNVGNATLTVTGGVYNLAAANATQTVDVGSYHVGVGKTASVTLSNTAPTNATYTETLQTAGFSGTSTNFSAAGSASGCLLYTSPSPRDRTRSRMPSSA